MLQSPDWKMVSLQEISPGSCFLYADGRGSHLAVAAKPEGTSLAWADIAHFPEAAHGDKESFIIAAAGADRWVIDVGDFEIDFDLADIFPKGRKAETAGILKPGMLILARGEYQVLGLDDDGNYRAVSLIDGSVRSRAVLTDETAVVVRWKLLKTKSGRVICEVPVSASRQSGPHSA
jgi:hypothetical protein